MDSVEVNSMVRAGHATTKLKISKLSNTTGRSRSSSRVSGARLIPSFLERPIRCIVHWMSDIAENVEIHF